MFKEAVNLNELKPKQIQTFKNIVKGFEELKLVEEGKLKPRPIEKLLNKLN